MSISWKSYMGISKLDTRGYLRDRKIINYEELLRTINPADVKPPKEDEICPSWYYLSTAEPRKDEQYTSEQISRAKAKIKPVIEGPSDKEIAEKLKKITQKVSRSKSVSAKKSNQNQDVTKRKAPRKTRSTKKE